MSRFVGSLFGTKAKQAPPATSLRISTSIQGQVVPLLLGGQQRMACNVIDYFGFYSVQSSSGGGGKGGVTGGGGKGAQQQTSYYVSCILGVCEGPVRLFNTWVNGSPGAGVLGSSPIAPNFLSSLISSFLILPANIQEIAQSTTPPLQANDAEFFDGDYSQDTWGYAEAAEPTRALSYRGLAYAAFANFSLGSSNALPQLNFECISIPNNGFIPGQPDGDPSGALTLFLTDPRFGLGFPLSRLGVLSGNPSSWQSYCKSLGLAVSPVIASAIQASSFANDLVSATNSAPCWQDGQLTVVPYGDQAVQQGAISQITETHLVPAFTYVDSNGNTQLNPTQAVTVGNVGTFVADLGVAYTAGGAFTPVAFPPTAAGTYSQANGTYTFSSADHNVSIQITYQYAAAASYIPDTQVLYDFTIDDFLPNQGTIGSGLGSSSSPVTVVRLPRDQMNNVIKVEYLDRNNAYNPVDIEFRDSAAITAFKRRRPSDIKQFHFFCLASAAVQSAALQLVRAQVARTYQFTVGKHFTLILKLMKIVTVTRPNMGLVRQPVRIIELQENGDQTLTVTCEDFPGTASAPVYGTEAAVGNLINYNVDPGLINTPIVFEPTDELGRALVSGGGLMIAGAVSGQNTSLWGGCIIWASYDGVNYDRVGKIDGPARMGVLSAQLQSVPINPTGQTIDQASLLAVDLTESGGTLAGGSQVDATSLNTRCFVGPLVGSSLISRTNLQIQSQNFASGAWFLDQETITSINNIAPDGSPTATLFTGTGGDFGMSTLFSPITIVSGAIYTWSVFLKAGTGTQWFVFLGGNTIAANSFAVWFDVINGVVGLVEQDGTCTVISQSITACGNGWFRVSVTATVGDTTSFFVEAPVSGNGSAVRPPIGTTCYVWGFQLETGSAATPYIQTTTAPVTVTSPGTGQGEIVAYQNATLTATSKYNLSYLVRGAFGTEAQVTGWLPGTGFARLDEKIFVLPFDKTRIGSTLFLKFTSFNLWQGGMQSLADVPAYSYQIQGSALASPLPVIANLRTTFVAGRLNAAWDEIDDFRSGIRYEIRQGNSFGTALTLGTVAHPPFVLPGDGTFWFTGWCQPAAGLIVRSEQPTSLDVSGVLVTTNIVATFDGAASNWPGSFTSGVSVDPISDAVVTNNAAGLLSGTYSPTFTVNVGRPVATTINITTLATGSPVGVNILAQPDILGLPDILGSANAAFVDVAAFVKISQDGVTYAPRQKYVPGDYFGVTFQFEFDLATVDPQTIAFLLQAKITAQVPPRIDHILTNGTLPAAGLAVAFTPDNATTPAAFNGGPNGASVPHLLAAWGDEQAGDVLSITGLSVSGATIQILNGGVGVTRNKVNLYAEGF